MRIFVFLFLALGSAFALNNRFKVQVPSGASNCYFLPVESADTALYLSYVVISRDSSHDITFRARTDTGDEIANERKNRNFHSVKVKTAGVIEMCLDNTHSLATDKLVNLIIHDVAKMKSKMGIAVDPVSESCDRIKRKMDEGKMEYQRYTALELLDRTAIETTYEDVNFWGTLNTVVMIAASVSQVIFVRRMLK